MFFFFLEKESRS